MSFAIVKATSQSFDLDKDCVVQDRWRAALNKSLDEL